MNCSCDEMGMCTPCYEAWTKKAQPEMTEASVLQAAMEIIREAQCTG